MVQAIFKFILWITGAKVTVMERQHFCFISILISGSFREDTYGNAGFHIVCGLKDRFQTLLDILSVEKETVEIAHPVGEQRIMLHFRMYLPGRNQK